MSALNILLKSYEKPHDKWRDLVIFLKKITEVFIERIN